MIEFVAISHHKSYVHPETETGIALYQQRSQRLFCSEDF